MSKETDTLLRELERKRTEKGLTHDAFARDCLGVSPAYWSLVRRGIRPLQGAIVTGTLRTFPELGFFVVAALHASNASTQPAPAA